MKLDEARTRDQLQQLTTAQAQAIDEHGSSRRRHQKHVGCLPLSAAEGEGL